MYKYFFCNVTVNTNNTGTWEISLLYTLVSLYLYRYSIFAGVVKSSSLETCTSCLSYISIILNDLHNLRNAFF